MSQPDIQSSLLPLPALRPRVIPVLLLKDKLLYKPRKFRKPVYVGDPRVAVKIFNEKGADELILIDIDRQPTPDYELAAEIASESFVPLAYGGNIRNFDHADKLLSLGVEKVLLNTALVETPELSTQIARVYGSQSVVGIIDYKRSFPRGNLCHIHGGTKRTSFEPVQLAQLAARCGVGEIVVQSMEREGTNRGYDLSVLAQVSKSVDIPVVALGGAGTHEHFYLAVEAGAAAVAAGSMFVFTGAKRAVLITYPTDSVLRAAFRLPPIDMQSS